MYIYIINWNAVAAISNIIVAIATFFAVIVSLRASNMAIKTKGKVSYTKEENPYSFTYRSRLTNTGLPPILVISNGYYYKKTLFSQKKILDIKSERKKLETSDAIYGFIGEFELNSLLLKEGFEVGELVRIYAFFQDSKNEFYTIKIKHLVEKPISFDSLKLQLKKNTQ